MTDQELLKRAARGCGRIPDSWSDNANYIKGVLSNWNPRDDDSDAFRLAAHLEINIEFRRTSQEVIATAPMQMPVVEPWSDDRLAATRRAIVRAAAAMAD